MTEVGVWLLVVALCDLVRAARDVTSPSRRILMAGLGACLFGFAGVASTASGWELTGLLLGWTVCFLLWMLGSAHALTGASAGHPRSAARARLVAYLGLVGGLLFSLLDGGRVDLAVGGLPGALAGVDPARLVLVCGIAGVQLATANVAVRLVLDAVGVPASTNEKQLKGGRLLGPMERLFIVGLGLAGQLTAAAVVVAAKGLLRFPELQRGTKTGPSDLTEYFLIGSFASWLVALGSLSLTALA